MKRKVGIVFTLVGVMCLVVAVTLFCYNRLEEHRAAVVSNQTLAKITDHIRLWEGMDDNSDDSSDSNDKFPDTVVDEPEDLPQVMIDSNAYVGYVSLPTLGLELPILADTDQSLLQIAPCRFTGSVKGNNLVIGAHNYQSHFGRLTEVSFGDKVMFTDMHGNSTVYTVVSIEILDPYAVSELTAGEYPLTLYTCTYGGASRVTVRLDYQK